MDVVTIGKVMIGFSYSRSHLVKIFPSHLLMEFFLVTFSYL